MVRNRTGKLAAKFAREWVRDVKKVKRRRRGSPDAPPTRHASPARQASYRARQEADAQQRAGRTNGTAEAVTTADGRHTAVSVSDGPDKIYPHHREVARALDSVPQNLRAPWHGNCALPQSLSKLLDRGVDPRGGAIGAARIRAPGNPGHGAHNPCCNSCKSLRNEFDLREAL
ncbi:YwqJ-like deaminase [Micromonospora sediminicola]|uniref:YwqJ-like deaminase n=1 Tax=Micromonospora sediminicola TaxID=946078 RepID=A0A1A9BHG0_9ACTN|nr:MULTISPECIES: hypothetical protein [Micromonospora]SBT68511.1 YwqJ-like deaminase [Micromonospora sediminicola]